MEIHFDKIIPLIIAIILIFANARKKTKKHVAAPKPSPVESDPIQATSGHEIFNPLPRTGDNITGTRQTLAEQEKGNENKDKTPVQKQVAFVQPIITDPLKEQVVFHDQATEIDYFDFDIRRAIIDAEIINRKYFTI